MVGSFIFVLHSHVPYVRKSGKWPHGEEMLHEIIAETYIPLLNTFHNLHNSKMSPKVSLGLTPILLEQIADKYMQQEFVKYIKKRIKAAEKDYKTFQKEAPNALEAVHFYIEWFNKILRDYQHKYDSDLISAFKYFQDHAGLDILTSAATHGYLPLMGKDSAIWGQLRTGINHYKKYFGRHPSGIWLPECGYRPLTADNRAGIETFLESVGIKYFFTDSHVIQSSLYADNQNTPIVMQPSNTPYEKFLPSEILHNHSGAQKRKKSEQIRENTADQITTFHPYYVDKSNVLAFGRDNLTGMQVWSAQWGYPGDFAYREFHKKAPSSGIQYWKISNKQKGLKFKEYYLPKEGFAKAREHAHHFTTIVTEHLDKYQKETGKKGVVVSSYDTELFGHWWFEGVHWLENVLKDFAQAEQVKVESAREYANELLQAPAIKLPESSWGNGGQHTTWLNPDTSYMWHEIHTAEARFEILAQKYYSAKGVRKKLLNQAARELLLLQSSDWPFLITTVQASDYAQKRFQEHLERFNLLCDVTEDTERLMGTSKLIFEIFNKDNAFKFIDYKDFANQAS